MALLGHPSCPCGARAEAKVLPFGWLCSLHALLAEEYAEHDDEVTAELLFA